MSGAANDVRSLPITVKVAAGAVQQDGIHVLARIDAPDLLREPAYLVFDGIRGVIGLTLRDGVTVHVELAALLLNLAQRATVAAPAASGMH